MSLEDTIKNFEKKLEKKQSFHFWQIIFIPLLVAGITAIVTIYTFKEEMTLTETEHGIKKVEVISTIVKDFSSESPERTVLLLSLLKSEKLLGPTVADRLEKYALSLTEKKLNAVINKGGKAAATSLSNAISIVDAAGTEASNELSSRISQRKFYIIVASDTELNFAIAFKKKLRSNGFPNAQVIKTSKRYAVSLALLPYSLAKKHEKKYESMVSFLPGQTNNAYLETPKSHWKIIGI